MDKTEQVLIGMLKENVGCHMLDSGGINGRHFQMNNKRKFIDEPEVYFSFSNTYNEFEFTINTFHFLNRALGYESNLTRKLTRWAWNKDNEDKSWYELMEDFPKWLEKRYGYSAKIIGGENTADGTWLEQVLNYVEIEINGKDVPYEDFIMLQIHGGADYRGGYTSPKIFIESCDYPISGHNRGVVYCDGSGFNSNQLNISEEISQYQCHANWSGGMGWEEWGYDGGYGNELTLDGFMDRKEIIINEDGVGICPMCHKGKLEGAIF